MQNRANQQTRDFIGFGLRLFFDLMVAVERA
jgi:hypothetical protein